MHFRRYRTVAATLTAVLGILLQGCAQQAGATHLGDAALLIEQSAYEDALASLSAANASGEDPRAIRRMEGIAYLRMAMYREAIDAFEEALSLSDGVVRNVDFDMNFYLAESYKAMGDNASAIEIYNNILALKPNDTDALYLRGFTRLQTGDTERAAEDFDRAVARAPRDFELRIRIFQAYESVGDTESGRALLESAMSTYSNAMSNYEKGRMAFYLGNNADAQNFLERARSQARGDERAQITLLLGQTGEKQGDYNYAIGVYTALLEEDSSVAEIFNRRGICRLIQGDYLSAIADFEAGLSLNDVRVNRALMRNEITAYEYAGDFKKARTRMNEYLRLYPDDTEAMREEIFLSTR